MKTTVKKIFLDICKEEEWLNEQHRNVIFTNSKLLKESLNLRKEIGN